MAAGVLGPIAVFGPDEVVGYLVRSSAGRRLFVFRTLAVDDTWAARVPGVYPRVRLLVLVRTTMRVRAVTRLFGYLAKRAVEASSLSDGFYVRVSVLVGGRADAARLRALAREEISRRTAQSGIDAQRGRS
jgi:hypothetical protein